MKKIILTGASSGFGLLAVKTLALDGNTVFATMRNINGANAVPAKELKEWAKTNNAQVEIVELDVTGDVSVKNAIREITKKTGGIIDVLINNAGISFIGLSETLSIAQTNQIFQVNVIGADRTIKAVLPFMHEKKDGLIINVTSVLARNLIPVTSTYNASKAALDALSIGYHYELQTAGIDVVTVQPGGYPTTDIVTKSVQAAHPELEAHYGGRMHKLKDAIIQYFVPNETSPDPQEVADAFAKLVKLPKGERPLWSIVGGGPLTEAFDEINESTRAAVDNMLSALGV